MMEQFQFQLPPDLSRKLRQFERKLRLMETIVSISGAGAGLLLSWCLLYFSDRLWATPWWVRLPLTAAGLVCGVGFAYAWIHRWILRRRNLGELARLIQREHPELGDRLQGIVELTQTTQPKDISPALVKAAIRQVNRESEQVDFESAIKQERGWTFGLVFLGVAAVMAPLFWFNSAAAMNAVHRWFNPLGPVDRYTFVNLAAVPEKLIVAHDEPFTLRVGIKEDSFKKPGTALARLPGHEDIVAEFTGLEANFQLPGLTETTRMQLRVWDVSREVTVEPVYRPAIKQLDAFVIYPEYLLKSPVRREVGGGHITVLSGSQVKLRADLGRRLSRVDIQDPATGRQINCQRTAEGFLTQAIAADKTTGLTLRWQDRYGLTPVKPYKVKIHIQDDRVPLVIFPEQPNYEAILIDETREMELTAEDDHGLRQLGVEWYVSDKNEKRLSRTYRYELGTGNPDHSRLSGRFIFSAKLMEIPAQTIVTLTGTTTDYFPDRGTIRSTPHKLYILSHAEHAREIKRRFEAVQASLEEVTRTQENLETEALALQNLDPEELADPKTAERIKELQRRQAGAQKELERLAREGMKLLEEAMRNKDIPPEMLQEWAQMLNTMRAIAGNEMKQAQRGLQRAREQKNMSRQDLKKAAEEMAKAIEKLQKMLKDLNDSLENMTARNFVNRLRQLASQEAGIKGKLQELLPLTVGAEPKTLSRSLRRRLNALVDRSRDVQREARTVMDDLGSFFNRTRVKKYDQVFQEMETVELIDQLDVQSQTIAENKSVAAMQQADRWQDAFTKWAKMLEQARNEQAPPNQSPQQMTAEQMMLLLKLMRVVQEEEEIRRRTRLLERRRDFDEDYAGKSTAQADQQQATRKVLNQVIPKAPPRAQQNLKAAGRAMDDAERFLRIPQTDGQTIAAETEVIERLTAGLNQSAQAMGQGSMSAMMQMLMQQMGMGGGAGPAGGGSTAGGGTDPGNSETDGPPSIDERAARAARKFSGKTLDDVPPEFREALKNYFNEVEKLER